MITSRWLVIPLAPLTLLLCAQSLPSTRPAPATATAPATQLSAEGEVRQVVLKMLVAMREGDRARLLSMCYAENASQRKGMEAMMDLGLDAHRVNKIAIARWGKSGDYVVDAFASEQDFKRLTEAMSKSTVMIEGNYARLEPAATDGDNDDVSTVFLRKISSVWRIDFSKVLEESGDAADPKNNPLADQLQFLQQQRELVVQLGKEIEAGKYRTAREAKTAFDKLAEDLAKKHDHEQPAEQEKK